MKILFFMTIALLLPWQGKTQTVLFRHADAKFENYKAALLASSFRSSPMDELEKRLMNDELPQRLQDRLNEVLSQAAREPSTAFASFENFYHELEQEPRSAAVRETMHSLLERLIPDASSTDKETLRTQLNMLKNATGSSVDLRLQDSLLHKEIQARLRTLRETAGGEDLTLFWNGMKWHDNITVNPEQKAQWIFLSSRWKPRLLVGTWSEISKKLEAEFSDWVSGSCQEPVYQDVSFVPESRREVFFRDDCIARKENFLPTTATPFQGLSSTQDFSWKPVIWAGVAATALVMILSASNKRVLIQR